jgi:hypothetical protein
MGGFGTPNSWSFGGSTYGIALADLNADGFLDIATAAFGGNVASVRLGFGTGLFGPPINSPAGSGPMKLDAGDINADGIMDLAVANQNSGDVSVLGGTGGGNFAAPINLPLAPSTQDVAIADLNGDGWLDLAGSSMSNAVKVWFSVGTLTRRARRWRALADAQRRWRPDGDADVEIVAWAGQRRAQRVEERGLRVRHAGAPPVADSPNGVAIADRNMTARRIPPPPA